MIFLIFFNIKVVKKLLMYRTNGPLAMLPYENIVKIFKKKHPIIDTLYPSLVSPESTVAYTSVGVVLCILIQ